ncbi:MAG TPA: hypothetical protein VLD19_16705, partial [Chitinophagaceae bacterium]|nr:hypothetical protein [Chitinophagaceae bacterium]
MDRKHFLRLSGAALGSLLVADAFGGPRGAYRMELPSKVLVRLDDGLHALTGGSRAAWTYKEVAVRVRALKDGLSVDVRSPKAALHQVLLQWDYPVDISTTMLGDHWER